MVGLANKAFELVYIFGHQSIVFCENSHLTKTFNIFIEYVFDLNAITVHAIPSCTDASMVTAFSEVITTLKTGGYCPALNVMDNECSAAVEKYISSEQINIQLVPPHNHRVNAAERAIATFKEHFIAALATVDMHCPLQLWDEFLLQVELTLNMLCFS